jgi:ribosomal protein L34
MRKIGGKIFRMKTRTKHKVLAKDYAKDYRKLGWNIRIIKEGGKYVLYGRKK